MSTVKDYHINAASIDVTNRCNFSCRHCFNYSGEHNFGRQELSDEELLFVAEQLSEIRPSGACICGGEPMLRKETVFKMVEILKHKKLDGVNMVSNGYLIDKKCAKDIKNSGLDMVQISVDGFSKETHDWVRNKDGAYEKAWSAIENLIAEGVRVGVACTPTQKSLGEIISLVEKLEEQGVFIFRMQPLMSLGRAKFIKEYYPTKGDYFKLSRKLNLLSQSGFRMKIEWGDPTEHVHYMLDGFNIRSVSVNSYGDLLVSPYIPISFGNVKNHTLLEYLESGLGEIQNLEFIKKICSVVKDENSLDISQHLNLPELYKEDLLHIDIIDDDLNQKNKEILNRMERNI